MQDLGWFISPIAQRSNPVRRGGIIGIRIGALRVVSSSLFPSVWLSLESHLRLLRFFERVHITYLCLSLGRWTHAAILLLTLLVVKDWASHQWPLLIWSGSLRFSEAWVRKDFGLYNPKTYANLQEMYHLKYAVVHQAGIVVLVWYLFHATRAHCTLGILVRFFIKLSRKSPIVLRARWIFSLLVWM